MSKANLHDFKTPSRRGGLHAPQREVKMLKPICTSDDKTGFQGCQDSSTATQDWWKDCPHDPYFSKTERERSERVVEGGRVTGYENFVDYEITPNLVQIALSERVGSGKAVEKKRKYGFILPEEYKGDALEGKALAPYCQFRDCWSQAVQFHTPYGDFCAEAQAKAVALDVLGESVEVFNDSKRRRQFAAIHVV